MLEYRRVKLIDGMKRHYFEITQCQKDGQTVGYLSRRRGTKSTQHPWQVWVGPQMTVMVGSFWQRDEAEQRLAGERRA